MSDDNLETLDNVSLRKKCLEFGLPNVPITDTSRKLLIRKLRVAMNGETDDKKKNRRETIHVTKIPSLVETNATIEEASKPTPSRQNRRTIAATSVTSTVDDVTLPESTKTQSSGDKRRSVRPQAETEAPQSVIPISQKRKSAAVLAEEEEDDDDVILIEAADQSEKIVIPRARRSVSLSKTGVVTTSYSQETVAAAPPTVNETESESEFDFSSKYASLYEPISRPLGQSQPLSKDITSYGLSEPKVVVEPDRTLSFRTTAVNRTSIEPEILYNKPPVPAASRYSSLGSGYSSNTTSSVNTSTTRRFTSGAYGAPAPAAKYTRTYEEQDENEENLEQTPYLSDFARKLERLKAEPLSKGVGSPRNIPLKRDTQRYHSSSSIVGRRSTMNNGSVADSFKNFLFALDRKYNLKRNLSILFAIIFVIFIYVVFIN